MSIGEGLREMLGKKPKEPELEKIKFEVYRDFYGHFSMFYPKAWRYDPPIVVDEGSYAVVFHSNKSRATFRVEVSTTLPLEFDFKKYAKHEIEGPSAGIISRACKSKFREYSCFRTNYEYETEGRKFAGERIIFYTGNRIFSIFYTYPEKEAKNLKKIFKYMIESLIVNPAKTKIFKSPLP